MLHLAAARNVEIGRPVELLAAVPLPVMRMLEPLRLARETVAREDLLEPRHPRFLLQARQLRRVGDECFPEVESDGADHFVIRYSLFVTRQPSSVIRHPFS